MIWVVVAFCLFIALCALVCSIYAIVRCMGGEMMQEEINEGVNEVLENHKQVWEGVNGGLINHKEKIEELYDILHINSKTVLQKFEDGYTREQ